MEMLYIKLYLDDLEALEPYGDAERGRLFTALLEYARTGEASHLSGNERFLFPMMRARLDRDREALEGLGQKRSEAGKKGAKAKLSKSGKCQQSLANEAKLSKTSNNKDEEKRQKTKIPPNVPPGRLSPQGEDVFAAYAQGDEALLEALREFEECRKKQKSPLTDRGKALLLSRLTKLSEGVVDKARYKRECLEEAVLNGWKSVYELKDFADGEASAPCGPTELLPDLHEVELPPDATAEEIWALLP